MEHLWEHPTPHIPCIWALGVPMGVPIACIHGMQDHCQEHSRPPASDMSCHVMMCTSDGTVGTCHPCHPRTLVCYTTICTVYRPIQALWEGPVPCIRTMRGHIMVLSMLISMDLVLQSARSHV